jgi:taurine dioxygenase
MSIAVRDLTPVIGAEIHGVDLGNLDDAIFSQVHEALLNHQVVFFRDQDISLDAQIAFGARFGELAVHPNDPGPEGYPEVLVVHANSAPKSCPRT